MKDFEIKATLDALWRIESARIIAVLTRMVGDIELRSIWHRMPG